MRTLVDVSCNRHHLNTDVWVETTQSLPECVWCGEATFRISAPSITPQGTRAERNLSRAKSEPGVNVKSIAEAAKFEIEQKWLRYSDEKIAEQHVSREINEAAGIADAAGNEKPVPTPDPITFAKPSLAECAR